MPCLRPAQIVFLGAFCRPLNAALLPRQGFGLEESLATKPMILKQPPLASQIARNAPTNLPIAWQRDSFIQLDVKSAFQAMLPFFPRPNLPQSENCQVGLGTLVLGLFTASLILYIMAVVEYF
ncbi:hypothetical protein BJX66DRAFT_289653 [Aspergillus keveii]|uniref:Uncharacterized protein n=1 Tax=Aspergillus keveii TaxID=714993 RepID=A0ABR4GQL3_9EURO